MASSTPKPSPWPPVTNDAYWARFLVGPCEEVPPCLPEKPRCVRCARAAALPHHFEAIREDVRANARVARQGMDCSSQCNCPMNDHPDRACANTFHGVEEMWDRLRVLRDRLQDMDEIARRAARLILEEPLA